MAITPKVEVYDLSINDVVTDAALLKTWVDALVITHVYGWAVTAVSNSRQRYTIVYD